MNVPQKIRELCARRAMTQKELAEKHGDLYQTFKNKISRNTMRFSEVERIFDELDCDLVVVDRKTGTVV